MTFQNVLAGIAVKDLHAAKQWYAAVLERPADSEPMPELAEWQFERGGWLQIFHDEQRAGSSSITLSVSNLDELVDKLEHDGIEVKSRSDGDLVRTAMIDDPEGNRVVLAESLSKRIAR